MRYFSRTGNNAETLARYQEKLAQLDAYHDRFVGQAKALKEPELLEYFFPKAEYNYVLLKASLIKLYDKENGIDFAKDSIFQAMIDKIDVNDPVVESFDLVTLFLKGKISAQYSNQPALWVVEFAKRTNQYITHPAIKNKMQQIAAQYATTYLKGDELASVWKQLKVLLQPDVVHAYQKSVDALVKLKSGIQACLFFFLLFPFFGFPFLGKLVSSQVKYWSFSNEL